GGCVPRARRSSSSFCFGDLFRGGQWLASDVADEYAAFVEYFHDAGRAADRTRLVIVKGNFGHRSDPPQDLALPLTLYSEEIGPLSKGVPTGACGHRLERSRRFV